MACARMEDESVLGGLWDAAEKSVPVAEWGKAEGPLQSVVAATELLFEDGFSGPYAPVMGPDLYADSAGIPRYGAHGQQADRRCR